MAEDDLDLEDLMQEIFGEEKLHEPQDKIKNVESENELVKDIPVRQIPTGEIGRPVVAPQAHTSRPNSVAGHPYRPPSANYPIPESSIVYPVNQPTHFSTYAPPLIAPGSLAGQYGGQFFNQGFQPTTESPGIIYKVGETAINFAKGLFSWPFSPSG